MDFILGLDMLKRYQCSIDLKRSSLILRLGAEEHSVRFLTEGELPPDKGGNKGLTQQEKEASASDSDAKPAPSLETTSVPPAPAPAPDSASASASESTSIPNNTASQQSVDTAGPSNVDGSESSPLAILIAEGYERNKVIATLEECGGNVEMARICLMFSSQQQQQR